MIPIEWKIHKYANEQTTWLLKNIDNYLFKFKDNKFRQLYPLLDLVQRMRADNHFNNEKTLAKLGILRGKLHPALLSEIAILIQTEFVRAEAKFNNNAVIYPGKSVQCLTNDHLEPLPFADYHQVKERIKSMGLNLNKLINLPATMLFDIAHSPQWLMIRNALLNNVLNKEILNKEIQQEIYSIFNIPKQVQKPLPPEAPIFMPSPWALVSQSLLGTAHVTVKDEIDKILILDLDSHVLYEKNSANSAVELTKLQTNFLSILVIVGKLGLPVELIQQWLIELDTIKWKQPELESQAKFNCNYDRFFLLRNRIYRLKSDINKKLKLLKLRISGKKGKGKWYLETNNSDQDFLISVSNTVWGELFEKKQTNYTPQGLSKQSKLIWHCLWEYSPKYVHAEIIADILEKQWNKKTQKQISDAVYKLKQQLNNEPWMIKHSLTGEYALVPRL